MSPSSTPATGERSREIFDEDLRGVRTQVSRVFLGLLLVQWLIAVVLALTISPHAWGEAARTMHFHGQLAVLGGALLNALPIALLIWRPAWWDAITHDAKAHVEHEVAVRTEELNAKREHYWSLIENTGAVPWEIDPRSCEILYMASQMSAMFDVPPERTAAHASFLELLHPDDRDAFRQFVKDASAGDSGGRGHIDCRVLSVGNRTLYVRNFIADRRPNGSHRLGGVCLDVTQQKQMERDLLQAQKLESIGQLSAGIAHEINTPTQFVGDNVRFLQECVGEMIGVIDGLAPLAALDPAHPIAPEAIDALLRSADIEYLRNEVPKAISQSLEGIERIARIVGAMKEFSHPALERTSYDLNRAIASTITVASNEWKYVAEVKTEFDAELPLVPVMPGAFNQVILNMLVNAAHAIGDVVAAQPSGAKGLIRVSTARAGEWAEIRIQDTGCGVPEEIRGRIFDPFFTTKQVGKGTGQGLAIAHDVIVNKHQGSIAVESVVGSGTSFVLRLPLELRSKAAAAA